MLRSAASKAMWVGRTTAAVIGLVIALAIVFGVATMALAAVPGDPFKLGKVNSINRISVLVGTATSPMLRVYNKGTGTALQLIVKDKSKPPMIVNSTAKVPRLNADRLDGKHAGAFLPKDGKAADSDKLDGKDSAAFLPADTYMRQTPFTTKAGSWNSGRAECDEGDLMIGGGYSGVGTSTHVSSSTAFIAHTGDGGRFWGTWSMLTYNRGTGDDAITVRVICADSTP